ncbi:hypothetical protein ABK040_013525 [Willaertia magna]
MMKKVKKYLLHFYIDNIWWKLCRIALFIIKIWYFIEDLILKWNGLDEEDFIPVNYYNTFTKKLECKKWKDLPIIREESKIKRIVCFSDPHDRLSYIKLPKSEKNCKNCILICAGDIVDKIRLVTKHSPLKQVIEFNKFLGQLKYFEHKFVIGGNWDEILLTHCKTKEERQKLLDNATYLENDSATFFDNNHKLKIFGTPFSLIKEKSFNRAFQIERNSKEEELQCELIPQDTDILITHCPPFSFGDGKQGSKKLTNAICKEKWLKPKAVIFGHYHSGYGVYHHSSKEVESLFINCSILGVLYAPYHPVIVFDYDIENCLIV